MDFVKVVDKNGVKEVTLNRPDLRNAFSPKMIAALSTIFKSLAIDSHTRLVVLRGEGSVFCSGADLQWMQEMVNYSLEQNEKDSLVLYDLFQSIYDCPIPVLGVAQGAAFGGALGLLACCDVVVTGEKTQFCFSEVKLGLAPAVISSFILRKISQGQARPWMLSGRIFDASAAQRMGLVTEVVADEDLQEKVVEVVHDLLLIGPEAARATKKLLNEVIAAQFPDLREKTTQLIAERRVSAEGQEGLKSFLSKKSPAWRKL